MKNLLINVVILFLVGCATTGDRTPIDQVPMYGPIDRNTIPALKAADEKLINDTTAHFGSREKASQSFVGNGFAFYNQGNIENAMRRFNQAWLLDKNNPDVYWGFSAVLNAKGQNCEAMEMIEKALELNPPKNQGFYPDAGRIITLCGANNASLSASDRIKLFEKSENLFIEAESFEPKKGYLYSAWANAYYWRGDYAKAWDMVVRSEDNGGQLPKTFLSLLESKQPRPN